MRKGMRAMALGGIIMLAAAVGTAFAETKAAIDVNVSDALKAFYSQNPKHQELASQASGMLVFPSVTKAGVGIAGEHGQGVLLVNGKTVKYYSIGGASVGLTLGVDQRSEIIMFMTRDSLEKFRLSMGWTVGADAGVAVMKEGDGGLYDSKTLQKPIIGFVYGEKGLMGDLSFEGSKITALNK